MINDCSNIPHNQKFAKQHYDVTLESQLLSVNFGLSVLLINFVNASTIKLINSASMLTNLPKP